MSFNKIYISFKCNKNIDKTKIGAYIKGTEKKMKKAIIESTNHIREVSL